jgi:hypothetical protein
MNEMLKNVKIWANLDKIMLKLVKKWGEEC